MPRPNLLLITIDALRADHLGCMGYGRSLSPCIDRLASEGVLFTQAIAHGPRSPASFPAILASIYQSSGAEEGLPPRVATLAEILKRHGYATAGLCAGNVYISRYFGYQRGFDQFEDFLTLQPGSKPPQRKSTGRFSWAKAFVRQYLEDSGRYDPAFLLFSSALRHKKNIADMAKSEDVHPFEAGERLNDEALDWLSLAQDGPFFLWLHYMEVHFPYLPRVARYRLSDYGRFGLSLLYLLLKRRSYPRRVLVDLYDDRIRDMDGILSRFLDRLDDDGFLQDTVLVLTADHGEEFWDHGGWVHSAKLYDELLRVPLIMKGPALPRGVVIPTQVGLIDLAPTILGLLGIEDELQGFQGKSLLPWLRGGQGEPSNPYVFSEEIHLGGRRPRLWNQGQEADKLYRIRSCRSEEWKYILDEEGNRAELYHLGLDPKETKNLADSEPQMRRQLESMLAAHVAALDSSQPIADATADAMLSAQEEEAIIRRLRDLGYM